MQPIRFMMVGGFLGAGKTTLIARLARHYMDGGKRVAVVTNDQAYGLVDTHSLRAQGFEVGEVAGACFCCKFDELVAVARQWSGDQTPDIVISEPVGSCTDLVATVIEPLRHLHGDQYEIAPLAVLLKPEHGLKILRGEQNVGFSSKAAYIFLKQLEEADIVIINKCDKLQSEERLELIDRVQRKWPDKPHVMHSSVTNEGFELLVESLSQPRQPQREFMEVDYDVYAAGEAELGWLNATYQLLVESPSGVRLNDVAQRLVQLAADRMQARSIEVAHLKVLVEDGQDAAALANLVGGGVDIELSQSSERTGRQCQVTVNARVAAVPEELQEIVESAVDTVAKEFTAQLTRTARQSLSPGRPSPTHRMNASV